MTDDYILVDVPKDLQVPISIVESNIIDLLEYSHRFRDGPSIAVQSILMILLHKLIVDNPNAAEQLKVGVDSAWTEMKRSMS